MHEIRISLGLVMGLISIYIIVMNWLCFLHNINPKLRGFASPGLFIGGLLGSCALLVVPFPLANKLWWIPIIVDWGSLPILVWSTFILLYKRCMNKIHSSDNSDSTH